MIKSTIIRHSLLFDFRADARIVLGAVAPTPLRARVAETLAVGMTLTKDLLDTIAKTASEETVPISDVRASAAYRQDMTRVLVRRALRKAISLIQKKRQGM